MTLPQRHPHQRHPNARSDTSILTIGDHQHVDSNGMTVCIEQAVVVNGLLTP